MSGVFKAIKKVFRAVVRVVKKIAVPALIIGAIVLTGGAALGALPALGGAGGILGSLGISGPLATVLAGAVKGVAFGAATGAIGGLLTGKSIWKSIKAGAIMGGLTGGVMAAIGPGGVMGQGGLFGKAPATAAAGTSGAPATASADLVAGAPASNLSTAPLTPVDPGASSLAGDLTRGTISAPGTAAPANMADAITSVNSPLPTIEPFNFAPQVPGTVNGGVQVPGGGGGGGGVGGFMNSPMGMMVGGQAISGLGSGLIGMAQAKSASKADAKDRASYDIDYQAVSPWAPNGKTNPAYPTVQDKYPSAVAYRYDPASGRVVSA